MTKTYVGDRFVVGPFGDVGYVAKRPGHGERTEKILHERAQTRLKINIANKGRRDSARDAYLNEYYRKFDELSLRASVNRMAELGMQEADNYFKVKQNKLRQLLLQDQTMFVEEYTTKAQTSLEKLLEQEKKKAEGIVKQKTNTDELRARQIYDDMNMKNSDEFREKLRLANIKNSSEACEEQIRIKECQKRLDYEDDRVWDLFQEGENRKAKLRIEREHEEIAEKKRDLLESLNRQIEDFKQRRKNEACVDEIEDEQNEKIRREWQDQLSKREEEALRRKELYEKALVNQIEANRFLTEQNRLNELLIEKIMQDDGRKKMEREADAYRTNKSKAWNELVMFKESVVQFRNAVAAAEEEPERLNQENRMAYERKQHEARRARENAQRDLRMDCVETSKLMVEEKKKKQAELKDLDFKRGELAERAKALNDRLDVELDHRTAVDRTSYNKAQSKYVAVLQSRQQKEDEEMLKQMRRTSEENSLRIKTYLERPVPEIIGTSLHPFYRTLRAHDKS